jgi:hypothetical protein
MEKMLTKGAERLAYLENLYPDKPKRTRKANKTKAVSSKMITHDQNELLHQATNPASTDIIMGGSELGSEE